LELETNKVKKKGDSCEIKDLNNEKDNHDARSTEKLTFISIDSTWCII